MTVVTLTGTLREKGEALEEEVALQSMGTALQEKEDSLSSLEEAARVQREEAQKSIMGKYLRVFVGLFLFVAYVDFLCSELRQKVADESAAKEAVHTALTAAQVEFAELEQTAVSVCQGLEGEGAVSGSSVISRLRALSGRIAEHAKSTFRLGVLWALAVASTHYLMDLQRVSSGYIVPDDADADAASAIMEDADAVAEEFAIILAGKLEADIPPIVEFDAAEDPQGGMVACRKSGPRSPCNRLAFIVITLYAYE